MENSSLGSNHAVCNDFESHNDLDLKLFLVQAEPSSLAVFHNCVPSPREHMSFGSVHLCGCINDVSAKAW